MNIREAINLVENTMDQMNEVIRNAMARLGFETTEARGRDALDFREVSVNVLRQVLEQVYEAGRGDAFDNVIGER